MAMLPAQSSQPSSEATQIEQSRAIAQVQGAIVAAQKRPRDTLAAETRMREACENYRLAERAFFRFSRGDGQVSGESIYLAVELARCWGNIDYGISELRRDEFTGESEMVAYAWDLETNARTSMMFIVPHARDTRKGRKQLVDLRDIYENNANQGARRVRECIFRILPRAYIDEAAEICADCLEKGAEGVPIAQRRAKMLESFAALGVTREQIERKTGQAADRLSGFALGQLGVVFSSIKRGEVTVNDEFPNPEAEAPKTSAAALAQAPQPQAPAPASEKPQDPPAEASGPAPAAATDQQQAQQPAPTGDGEPPATPQQSDQAPDMFNGPKAAPKAGGGKKGSPQDSPYHLTVPMGDDGQPDYEAYAMALKAVVDAHAGKGVGADILKANPAIERLAFDKTIPDDPRKAIANIRAALRANS
jgi:hypothetical protein